ncbi:39S ribosomal protein L39, mitochondrial-like [Asterias rubens]|uniref:39S ribosomal protein L39, mitochondrial-like n=1 Tax=Asterias rubens TaxID=7604 RepID=UPI0014555724|nr:39S ribosomal protein L39, mitochondrial-like [Asterias rubens]
MKWLRHTLSVSRFACRCMSTEVTATNTAVTSRQNEVFEKEKQRQLSLIKRIEKIEVEHVDPNEPCKFMMNKYLSTPYHAALHLNQRYLKHSAIAMVNGKPWHMLQPLIEDCELRFVTMKDDDVREANQAFWRSCSHMMGAILHSAFKDDVRIQVARSPEIPISKGCFAYDVNLPFKWEPTREEIICLNRQAFSLAENKVNFERLEVSREVALSIFEDNTYKKQQIEETQADRIILFRLGEFVDISEGPMVTNTGFIEPCRFVFTCIHGIEDYLKPRNKLLRFQGVALPSEFQVHHTAWSIIQDRAKKPILLDLAPSMKSSQQTDQTQQESTS